MSGPSQPPSESFSCEYCHETIYIPHGLPPTTAPCPHCGKEVTSPDLNQVQETATVQTPAAVAPVDEAPPEDVIPGQEDDSWKPGQGPAHVRELEDIVAPKQSLLDGNGQKNERSRMLWLAGILVLLAAGGAAFWLAYQWKSKSSAPPSIEPEVVGSVEDEKKIWMERGWMGDASKILDAFMKATSPEERMQYVIPNEGVLEELKMFYPEGRDDSDTPLGSFAHRSGSKRDQERGIFLMQYRQPPQIDIREYFSPIGSLDKILGVENSTLIEMAYQINEDNLSKPVAINAFFKNTDQGLKLDASVFIQGKFRTFRSFVDYPRPGKTQVFRVVVSESMDHELRDDKRYRTYRLDDFAYTQDHVNVPVRVDSELGKILSVLNWRGMNRDMSVRTATVELAWSNEKPSKLQLRRILCWQFLGVGGEIGNIQAADQSAPDTNSGESSDLSQQGGE